MASPTPPGEAPAGAATSSPGSPPAGAPSVKAVLAAYSALCQLARERFGGPLGGKLLLADSLERSAASLLAGSIAGAASLTAEPDKSMVRQALRDGVIEFAVTHLDEALRILKNEIRKRQPVAVCVEANPAQVLAEMAERGAQPDVIAWNGNAADPSGPLLSPFLARGAVLLRVAAASNARRVFVEWTAEGASAALLRTIDALAQTLIPAEDWERQNWLRLAPRYLARPLRHRRIVPLTLEEADQFRSRLAAILLADEGSAAIELRIGENETLRFKANRD